MVRWKKRYFVLNVHFQKKEHTPMKTFHVKNAILESVKKLYGEFGVASVQSGFQVKYANVETGMVYIRVNRSVSTMVSAALPIITSIFKDNASVSCLFVAATLRHANLFLKRHHEKKCGIDQSSTIKQNWKQKITAKRKQRV